MASMTREQAIAFATAPGQPGELVMETVRGQPQKVFKQAPPTLRAMYEATASDLPFIQYQEERFTFAQAWAQAARIGQVLVQHAGVKKGDRVAISLRNYPEWPLAFEAITAIGAIAVALNGHWTPEEMAFALSDCGATALLVDQERLDRLAQCTPASLPAGMVVLAVRCQRLAAGARDLQALTQELTQAQGDVPMPAVDLAPDDLATILYTSGSTGHPKGVASSHRNIVTAMLSWELDRTIGELVAGITPEPPAEQPGTLLAVPLFHVTGLHASFLVSYRAQRRMVSMYRWDPEHAAQLIQQYRLTSVVAPAAVTGDLVRVAQAKAYDLGSLLTVGGGGAPRAPEQVRQIRASFGAATMPNIGWGMTETNAIGTGNGGEEYLAKPSSSGRCSQVLQLKVVDDAGQALPAFERGELLIRGTSMFAGYWNRPEANAASFIDGWFRTGDVAYIDDEGFLFIVDRIKDLIIRGGENIGCGAVEAALLLHPQVLEAAVYAVPDERLGEEVGATVYAQGTLDLDELRQFLGQHLARFEVPRYVQALAEPLPRTPSGKILKREIRAQALPGFQGPAAA